MARIPLVPVVRILVLACVAGLASGCAGQLTVPQAVQITRAVRKESFTPPPRTIQDVLEQLQSGSAPEEAGRYRARAAEPPPVGATERELAIFHLRRAMAAADAGRLPQYLQDVRMADEYLRKATSIGRVDGRILLRNLGLAEAAMGRVAKATNAIERANRLQQGTCTGNVLLAQILFRSSQHAAGVQAIGAGRAHYHKDSSRSGDDPCAPNAGAELEAVLAEAEGRWVEAEVYWRKALELHATGFSGPMRRNIELGGPLPRRGTWFASARRSAGRAARWRPRLRRVKPYARPWIRLAGRISQPPRLSTSSRWRSSIRDASRMRKRWQKDRWRCSTRWALPRMRPYARECDSPW
jgi:tetratricopeptide (TPR) repeat protein